jgi:hypothetical protein
MQNIQLLNSESHQDLKIINAYNTGLGYDTGAVMILPSEIPLLQANYPLLFRKHPETGRLFPNALLSFKEDENLFLDENRNWRTRHIPLIMQKGPFMITFQQDGNASKPVLSINMDDPRVNHTDGEPLFVDQQPSSYLQHTNQVLSEIHSETEPMNQMVDSFMSLDLIEPLTLDIQFENGEKVTFSGAYTISAEKLAELSSEDLHQLNQQGHLANAFFIANSLTNVSTLIDIKNKQSQ